MPSAYRLGEGEFRSSWCANLVCMKKLGRAAKRVVDKLFAHRPSVKPIDHLSPERQQRGLRGIGPRLPW